MKLEEKQSLVSQNSHQESLKEALNEQLQPGIFLKQSQKVKTPKSKSNKIMLIFFGLIGVFLLVFAGILLFKSANEHNQYKIYPSQIRLAIYDNVTIQKGNSRVLQVLFYSGFDDRGSEQFKIVNQRQITWHVEPQGIIEVENYGRINAIKPGMATLKVSTVYNSFIFDQKIIIVTEPTSYSHSNQLPKKILNYTGTPAKLYQNFQKIVTRIDKENVQNYPQIPQSIKKVSLNPETSQKKKTFTQNDSKIVWSIESYADGSNNAYVKRLDTNLEDGGRDKIMMFIGDRYLPQDGRYALSIQDDQKFGIWIVGRNGAVTHIEYLKLTYEQKAQMMVKNTQKYVIRQGIASEANYDSTKQKWVTGVTDNDGLWTSLYAVGQLMRYDHLRSIKSTPQKIKQARQSAFPSLKAVLITDWISGRSGQVDAKIRSFNNSRYSRAYRLSSYYLKKNSTFAVQNYVGSPSDKFSYYGLDANKTVGDTYFGGEFNYSLHPFNMDDWSETEEPATTKRSLGGFMARTFAIPELDGLDRFNGLFFQRFSNGSHLVLNQASELYDYTNNDHPLLQVGNESLPQILKSNLLVNGKQYDVFDMVYKGETSTDEVIGHLFLYKIAFDIMDESDPQEKALKDLIKSTMVKFTQHLLNNGYQMVDATGQGTSWSKLVRDFLNNDYTTEDAPLKALQLLLCFKLTHYMTGDEKYQKQYEFLINDPSFRYGELVSKFWQRWVYFNQNQDYEPSINLYRFNFTQNTTEEQLLRHHFYTFHYSDDQEAMLAFYLIFQLQTNETLLTYYKQGMEAYWNHMKKSQNPLWYFIYQLAYPNNDIKDVVGGSILETASWQLSRHPIDTTRFQAYIIGSRPDVILEGSISVNPFKVIGQRTNQADITYASNVQTYKIYPQFDPKNIYEIKTLPADQRSIHKFNGANFQNIQSNIPDFMEASTTYTLPYWFGIYHKMLSQSH